MTDNALILIAEDEEAIAGILDAYLQRQGLRTVRAADGEMALIHHDMLKPDLVLLDVRLPKRDGFAVLAAIRGRGNTPVIMVTAMAEDLDRLGALRGGADDYVVKPFNPLEVVARVQAVLRRTMNGGAAAVLRYRGLEVDLQSWTARVVQSEGDAAVLDLTLTEFRILAHMIRAPGRVFSRAELVDACMPESSALERTVDTHASNLRRKLDRAGMADTMASVRGVGYRLHGQS